MKNNEANYIKIINSFWDLAPHMEGYKSDFGILFFALIDSINKNNWKDIEIDFDRIIHKSKLGKRTYLEGRKWLKENEFISLIEGRGDYQKAKFGLFYAVQISTAPDTAISTATDTAPDTAFVPHIEDKPLNLKTNKHNSSLPEEKKVEGFDLAGKEQKEFKEQIERDSLNPKLNKKETLDILRTDLDLINQVLREFKKSNIKTESFCLTNNDIYQATDKFKQWYEGMIEDCILKAGNDNKFPRKLGDTKMHVINFLRYQDFSKLKVQLTPKEIVTNQVYDRKYD